MTQNLEPLEHHTPNARGDGTEEELSGDNIGTFHSEVPEELEIQIPIQNQDPNLVPEIFSGLLEDEDADPSALDETHLMPVIAPTSDRLNEIDTRDHIAVAHLDAHDHPPAFAAANVIPPNANRGAAPVGVGPLAPPPPPPRNDLAEMDLELYEFVMHSPLWKTIGVGILIVLHNVVSFSLLTIVPIKLGRFILSGLLHFIFLTQSIPSHSTLSSSSASIPNMNILKFNVQHHDKDLYLTVFRIVESQKYPLPKNPPNLTDHIEEISTLNEDSLYDEPDYEIESEHIIDQSNVFRAYFKNPLTVDRITNQILNIIELSVGNMCLLTLVLLLYSVLILTRRRNSRQPRELFPPQQMASYGRLLKVSCFLALEFILTPIFLGWLICLVTFHIFAKDGIDLVTLKRFPLLVIIFSFCIGTLFSLHVSVLVTELRKIIRFQYLNRILPHPDFEDFFQTRANSSIKSFTEKLLVKLSIVIPSIVLMIVIPFHFGHLLFLGGEKYQLHLGSVAPATVQLPLELVLTHFFLPTILRKYNHSECMKTYIFAVLIWSCDLVGIRSYVLEDDVVDEFLLSFSFPQPIIHHNIVHAPHEERVLEIENQIEPPLVVPVSLDNVDAGTQSTAVIDHHPIEESEARPDAEESTGINDNHPELGAIQMSESDGGAETTPEPDPLPTPVIDAPLPEPILEPLINEPRVQTLGGHSQPNYLILKCLLVTFSLCLATSLIFSLSLHLPLLIGEYLTKLLRFVSLLSRMFASHHHLLFSLVYSLQAGNDYYSFTFGIAMIAATWVAITHLLKEISRQAELIALTSVLMKWIVIGVKSFVLGSIWLTILPLLVGILTESALVVPLWIPHGESYSFSFLHSWAIGLLDFAAWMR
jgi:hypothetical protein